MNKITALGGAIALAMSMNTQAAIVGAVDLFDVGQSVTDTTSNGGTLSDGAVFDAVSGPLTSILGGERDVAVEVFSDTGWGFDAGGVLIDGNTKDGAHVDINTVQHSLTFSNDEGISGQATIQWDGADNLAALNTTGLGGINLIATGADAFQFETISTDLGFLLTIEAYTDNDHFTKALIKTTGPRIDTILFSSLMDASLCGLSTGLPNGLQSVTCGAGNQTVNLASLGAIQTILNVGGKTASIDLKIGKIVTVPEPSVIGLMGAGLLAAGFVGTRRRTGALQA